MLEFHEITLADREKAIRCAHAYSYPLCEHCFTDLFIWNAHYGTKICFYRGFMLLRMKSVESGKTYYLAPVGEGDLADVIREIETDAGELGVPFRMISIPEEMIPRIEAVCPGKYEYSWSEDAADYVYLSEKLRTLSGKKLQSKRNLVNRFLSTYEGRWSYEDITEDNKQDALQLHYKWCELNSCARETAFQGETCAVIRALNNFDALDLRGGLLRVDGKPVAFTLGCRSTDDVFVVQIEKADHNYPGAYQMINQQFVLHNCQGVLYVNREEDLGIEGLRKAKQSYHPAFLAKKYVAIPKEEA